MAIISSVGSLQSVNAMASPVLASASSPSSTWLYNAVDPYVYGALYRTQPSVRMVVDFLARNIAQLGLHVYRRVSDTDRERLLDHQLADWLAHPTQYTTRYRLIESTLQDLGIYFNAYWAKVRMPERIGLQRLPPAQMTVIGGLVPSVYRWVTSAGDIYDFAPRDVVHFSGYDPDNPLMGLSPLETLRRVIAEDVAAMAHREAFWTNAARIEGVVERPLAAKLWSPEQVDSFKGQWSARFTGAAGAGTVPVLQEGMSFKPIAFSPRQAEYVQARKLSREEVASAYHIPLPMVGILEHATFSNIKEQHKQLYQDSLGPWLEMIAEEIERQLLVDCADQDRVYVEFNIAEKLSGSFEEQAASLQTLIGAPIMTRNEGRARLNLPSIDEPGADALVRPLNTTTTSDATVPASVPPSAVAPVIERAWRRQAAVLRKVDVDDRALAFDDERWTRELAHDLKLTGVEALQAERLAYVVNRDTRTRLEAQINPFTREASDYVDD